MLTNITLANFKLFQRVRIEPKLITVLIGPNGSGKSGILQALLLLKQSMSVTDGLDLNGSNVQLPPEGFANRIAAGMRDSVWLSIGGFKRLSLPEVDGPVEFSVNLQYAKDGSNTYSKSGMTKFNLMGNQYEVVVPRHGAVERLIQSRNDTVYAAGLGADVVRLVDDPPEIVFVDDLSEHARMTAALGAIFRCPTNLLAEMKWVPASRYLTGQPQPLEDAAVPNISASEGLGQQEAHTISNLAYGRALEDQIACWLKAVTGVAMRVNLVQGRQGEVLSIGPAGEVNLAWEGSGSNALIRLLYELADADSGSTILMEEPEISLHPKAQADLASVIANEAQTQNKQVIMTTHSEIIPGRLLIEIAEGKLTPDDLAIYAFHKDENGVGSATEITINERGQTTGGLPGFFDTHMQEMGRHARALMPEQ